MLAAVYCKLLLILNAVCFQELELKTWQFRVRELECFVDEKEKRIQEFEEQLRGQVGDHEGYTCKITKIKSRFLWWYCAVNQLNGSTIK